MRAWLRRAEVLRAVNAALAVCLAAALALAVRPAWQQRSEALQALAQREEQAARQFEIAASLGAAEAELEEARRTVARREAELAPPGGDMAVVRVVEELAGAGVVLKYLSPGELRPAPAPDRPEAALYCELPLRVEAEGAQERVLAFLRELEDDVPGFRTHSVSLSASGAGDGRWDLGVSGVVVLLAPCE